MNSGNRTVTGVKAAFLLFSLLMLTIAHGEITIQATPDNGMQPRMVVDESGDIHLLYFKKRLNRPAAREGSLYYRQYDATSDSFGRPVKVSSQAFPMQSVSISRAAMAVDGEGRVHVMWHLPRSSEFMYSRSNPERTSFEAQQSMVSDYAEGIDAGGDVAARGSQVALVWGAGDLTREDERTMFARFSQDGGASFGPETMISNPDLGACACCSMAVEYMSDADFLVAYRSAIDGIGRHMQLLTVNGVDGQLSGASYGELHPLQEWEASFCPLSTNDIAIDGDDQRWLVFETQARIMQLRLGGEEVPSAVGEPFIETRQKNPAVAFNSRQERLIVWGEAISHSKGGRLNLRLFDAEGKDLAYELADEIQIGNFSFPAAAALPNGDFLVLY